MSRRRTVTPLQGDQLEIDLFPDECESVCTAEVCAEGADDEGDLQ